MVDFLKFAVSKRGLFFFALGCSVTLTALILDNLDLFIEVAVRAV